MIIRIMNIHPTISVGSEIPPLFTLSGTRVTVTILGHEFNLSVTARTTFPDRVVLDVTPELAVPFGIVGLIPPTKVVVIV